MKASDLGIPTFSRSNDEEDDTNLKYLLAAAVFATAFGNIFVAQRMKNVMGYGKRSKHSQGNSYTYSSAPRPGGSASSSSSSWSTKAQADNIRQQLHEAEQRQRRIANSPDIPVHIKTHLRTLDLPSAQWPTGETYANQRISIPDPSLTSFPFYHLPCRANILSCASEGSFPTGRYEAPPGSCLWTLFLLFLSIFQ